MGLNMRDNKISPAILWQLLPQVYFGCPIQCQYKTEWVSTLGQAPGNQTVHTCLSN